MDNNEKEVLTTEMIENEDPQDNSEESQGDPETDEKLKETSQVLHKLLEEGKVKSFICFINTGDHTLLSVEGKNIDIAVSMAQGVSELVNPENIGLAKNIQEAVNEGMEVGVLRGLENLKDLLKKNLSKDEGMLDKDSEDLDEVPKTNFEA